MFQPGELIFYGRTGVCRVMQLEEIDGQAYYRLSPLYQSYTIRTPVNGKVFMRPVLTHAEADALIDQIPSVQAVPVECRALRELAEHYLTSINTHDAAALLAMLMSIHAKKQQALSAKRKLGAIDERFMKEGEALLFGELAVALDCAPDEVPKYIRARVSNNESRDT